MGLFFAWFEDSHLAGKARARCRRQGKVGIELGSQEVLRRSVLVEIAASSGDGSKIEDCCLEQPAPV